MANCNTTELLAEARQLSGLSEKQLDMAVAVLLQRWSENTDTASELLLEAKCFQCLSKKQLLIALAQLLCRMMDTTPPTPVFSYEPSSASVDWTYADLVPHNAVDLEEFYAVADLATVFHLDLSSSGITSISNLSLLPLLEALYATSNPLTSVDVSGCMSLTSVYMNINSLTPITASEILCSLDVNGLNGALVDLRSNGFPAPTAVPTAAGLVCAANLTAKGWAVSHD